MIRPDTSKRRLNKFFGDSIVIAITILPIFGSIMFFNSILRAKPNVSADIDFKPTVSQKLNVFEEPIITITFDDGWDSIYKNAVGILEKYNFKTTQYIISQTYTYDDYMSVDEIESLRRNGHEIASHSQTHADLAKIDENDLLKELRDSKTELEQFYGDIKDFSYPFGSFNDNARSLASQIYRSVRTVEPGINNKNEFDRYSILANTIGLNTSIRHINELIDSTAEQNGWLILLYHQVDDEGRQYSVTPETFEEHLKLIQDSNIKVATMSEVLDELFPE